MGRRDARIFPPRKSIIQLMVPFDLDTLDDETGLVGETAEARERAEARLEALLLEGLRSGEPIPAPPEYWETKRLNLIARHAGKTSQR